MSEFSITFEGVRSALDRNSAAAGHLSNAAGSVRAVRSGLTFKIRQRSQIDARLNALAQELEEHNASLRRLIAVGNNVCGLYQRSESQLLGGPAAAAIAWVQPGRDYIPDSGTSRNILEDVLLERSLQVLLTRIPSSAQPIHGSDLDLAKILDKLMGQLDMAGGGLLGDITDYIDSFKEFFAGDMSGLSGFADWANLADDSVGLWSGIYDLYKDLGATGDLFTEEMAQRVQGIGLIGNLLGTVGAYMDMMDTTGKSFEEQIEDTADLGISGTKAGISALRLIGGLGALPAHIYTSIAESGFNIVAQIGESIDKYNDDGWDWARDTDELLIDVSCEGLYSLGNALTLGGLGWVLDKITGNEDGDYGEMLSDSLKSGAYDFAEWLVDTGRSMGEAASDIADDVKAAAEDVWDGLVSGWNYVFG